MEYRGNYLNGRSSELFPCHILFQRGQIRIRFQAETGEDTTVNWNPTQLHPHISSQKHTHTLTYGEFPYQSLIIADEHLPFMLQKMYPDLGLIPSHKLPLSGLNIRVLFAVIFGFFGLIALTYFVLLPWGAEMMAQHIPKDIEIEIGESAYNSFIEGYSVNEKATDDLNKFLWQVVDTTAYPIKATVVKNDMINAFALPGGHIVVFDSIIKSMQTYEELAALLGHEYSHVKLHHSTRSLIRSLSSLLFVSIIIGDMTSLLAVVAQNANSINNLQYSRRFEEDADKEGMNVLKAKHINLNGMLHLFQTLKSSADKDVPDFLSTHPATDKRIAHVKAEIADQPKPRKNVYLEQLFKEIKADLKPEGRQNND